MYVSQDVLHVCLKLNQDDNFIYVDTDSITSKIFFAERGPFCTRSYMYFRNYCVVKADKVYYWGIKFFKAT